MHYWHDVWFASDNLWPPTEKSRGEKSVAGPWYFQMWDARHFAAFDLAVYADVFILGSPTKVSQPMAHFTGWLVGVIKMIDMRRDGHS